MLFKKIIRLFKRAFISKHNRRSGSRNVYRKKRLKKLIRPASFHRHGVIRTKKRKFLKQHSALKKRKSNKKSLGKRSIKKNRIFKRKSLLLVGVIIHYFPKVNAAVVKLKKPLKIGDPIQIKGKTTDFKQMVSSMQIDRRPIESAKARQEIGLEVLREVRSNDLVYIVKE